MRDEFMKTERRPFFCACLHQSAFPAINYSRDGPQFKLRSLICTSAGWRCHWWWTLRLLSYGLFILLPIITFPSELSVVIRLPGVLILGCCIGLA
ncbi:hypothetical protein BJX61DRAFT_500216 [Aspergillus egyptiacus]|nr:hypothetical protein BJX61DRAFT_500216 [Aspergillus egyptiacus]